MIKAVVFLAEGFEEVEAFAPVDLMRRAGFEVVIAGIGSDVIRSSHGVKVTADISVNKIADDYDIYFCPGGMPGAANLRADKSVTAALLSANGNGKIVSAICASPAVVLGPIGILEGHKATCYPGCESYSPDFDFSGDGVVVSGNVITGKSAGYALDFALALIKSFDPEKAEEVRKGIYYKES